MARPGFYSLRATEERQARLADLGRRIHSDSTATIIDHALGVALAHTPKSVAVDTEIHDDKDTEDK